MARKIRGRKHKRPTEPKTKPVILTATDLRAMKLDDPNSLQHAITAMITDGDVEDAAVDPSGNLIAILKE